MEHAMFLLERHFVRHALYYRLGIETLRYPLAGYVYLTYGCNLACSYCNDGQGVKYPDKILDGELTLEGWTRAFTILRRDIDQVIITGGEPFYRPDLTELLRRLKEDLGYRVIAVLTNGLNLDEHLDALDWIDILMISLDTMDADKADKMMRLKGAHERIIRNIHLANGLRREKGFNLQLNMCVTPYSVADANGVVDFGLEHGIGMASVPELRGFYVPKELQESEEYLTLAQRVIDLKLAGFDVPGSMLYVGGIKHFDRYHCLPMLLARIRPNGDVIYPCNKVNTVGGNLLKLGDYGKAAEEGLRRHGPIPTCDNRCHAGCYMDFSLLVQKPWWLLHEAYLAVFRKPFFSSAPYLRKKEAAPPS